jgi:hypothetical protein
MDVTVFANAPYCCRSTVADAAIANKYNLQETFAITCVDDVDGIAVFAAQYNFYSNFSEAVQWKHAIRHLPRVVFDIPTSALLSFQTPYQYFV